MSIDYTQVPHHRRLGPLTSRWGRRCGAAVLVVATLAIGGAITSHTPDTDRQQRPFIRTGSVGSAIDARTFTAKVLGVRGAAVITAAGDDHDTSGVWIVVRVELTAKSNPTSIAYAALVDSAGRTYRATGRIDQSLLGGRELEPGIPVTGEIAFEVPASVATDVQIRLATQEFDLRMDAVAQVGLPLTAAEIRRWRATTKPITVAAPRASM